MKKLLFLPLLASTLFAGTYDVSTKITYDKLTLPKAEKMGVVGVSYLLDITPNLFFGGTIFGAVDGKRGGFFTGGVEGGVKYPLQNFILESGLFVGGGGGGSAPQGGGLMLRGYGGVLYDFKNYQAGVTLSKVKFPNGDIDSNQLSFEVKIPFKATYLLSKDEKLSKQTPSQYTYKFVLYNYYQDKQDIKVLGAEIEKKLSQNFYGLFQAGGAFDGGADGFAEVYFGSLYRQRLTQYFDIDFKALVGASGGGEVKVGGGLGYKGGVELSYHDKSINLSLGAGRVESDGEFGANYLSLSFGKSLEFGLGKPNEWGISLFNQRYFSNSNMRKTSTKSVDVDLVGIKIDRKLKNNLFFSATALGAYRGDAGGYAVGLVGIGYKKEFEKLYLKTELQVGAGGGGGIDSGEALLFQPEVGLGYNITKNLSLELSYSKVKSKSGGLDVDSLSVGFRQKFFMLEK